MDDIEAIRERLENIQGVSPLINSLRTIAAGGWRVALRQLQAVERYTEEVGGVLASLLAHEGEALLRHPAVSRAGAHLSRMLILVIASEQGLCGAFNDTVFRGAEQLIAQQQLRSDQVLLATLGSQAEHYFRRQGRDLYATYALPVTRVPSSERIAEIVEGLRAAFLDGEVDAISIIYSPYRAGMALPPVVARWLPVDAGQLPSRAEAWPEPVIETEPSLLFEQALGAWIGARFAECVLSSSAAEQSARYRAMENASGNITRMIDELTLSYHSARQHAITMEMLDLTAASGILRGPRKAQSRR